VLATDDAEQNWAGDKGLFLAKELLHSSIETNTNLSVYELHTLRTTFDVVLCLGVYYHLIDPFYAFAQIRHCCHDDTVLIFEGDVASNMPSGTGLYNLTDPRQSRFQPTHTLLYGLLEATYFSIESTHLFHPRDWLDRLRWIRSVFQRKPHLNRVLVICRPFRGENRCYWYRPPFGLDHYDIRWTSSRGDSAKTGSWVRGS
jgi:tRNA (mo5U34)-methyltransferase